MTKNTSVTILGAGNMGTAIAQIIEKNGFTVKLWNYSGDLTPLEQISKTRENLKYLPGVKLSKNIIPESNLEKALSHAEIVFFVLPSTYNLSLVKTAAPYLKNKTICVDTSKGLDKNTLLNSARNIQKYLPPNKNLSLVSISGPSVATDMVRENFTAMNIAGKNSLAIKKIKKVLVNNNLSLIETTDINGIQIAGSLKNIYAIANGIGDCFAWTMNTRSILFVQALKEMAELIVKMGGEEKTAFGLAGLGDLICTAMSIHSRNRRFGECLIKYQNKEVARKKIGQAVEGIDACQLIPKLEKKYKLKMPLAHAVYDIVWKNSPAEPTLRKILNSLN